jgi:hypothetical protein
VAQARPDSTRGTQFEALIRTKGEKETFYLVFWKINGNLSRNTSRHPSRESLQLAHINPEERRGRDKKKQVPNILHHMNTAVSEASALEVL